MRWRCQRRGIWIGIARARAGACVKEWFSDYCIIPWATHRAKATYLQWGKGLSETRSDGILARLNVKSLLMIWILVIHHESGIVPKCHLPCNRDDETRLMSSYGKVGGFLRNACNLLSISGHESEPWCSVMSSRLPLRWQPFGQSRMVSSNLNIQDIDNDHSDPQMCHGYIRAFAKGWS